MAKPPPSKNNTLHEMVVQTCLKLIRNSGFLQAVMGCLGKANRINAQVIDTVASVMYLLPAEFFRLKG